MQSVKLWVLPLLGVLCWGGVAGAAAVPAKMAEPEQVEIPEAVEMLVAILSGSGAGPGAGWFHPSQSQYDWKWLAARMDKNKDGVITRKEFTGPKELFDQLDRDGDGRLTAADFDWSPRSTFAQQTRLATGLFRRANKSSNGRMSKEEWDALFQQAARGKDHLTPDDLRRLLFPPPPPRRPAKAPANSGEPSRWTLLKGLFLGEIGSMREGPKLGQLAPDFKLTTQDGKKKISLSDYRGKKPVVLIFGNFT
jgi:hypothetical protein